MKKQQNKHKLSLKKFQIAKISNPQRIVGGTRGICDDDDDPTNRTTNTMTTGND